MFFEKFYQNHNFSNMNNMNFIYEFCYVNARVATRKYSRVSKQESSTQQNFRWNSSTITHLSAVFDTATFTENNVSNFHN